MQKQQILAPQARLEEKTPQERLRAAFGMKGFAIFTLKARFGSGFLATRLSDLQLSAVCVRSRQGGRFEVQCLEHPSSAAPALIEEVRAWSKVDFCVVDPPLCATEPGGPFRWHELIVREEVLSVGLSPDDLNERPMRRYRAGPEGHLSRQMRGEAPAREPLARIIRIGSRRRRNVVLGGGRNFPRLGPG